MSITYRIKSRGLGTNICFLSLLLSTKEHIELRVDTDYSYGVFFEIKKIFNIPDSKLIILPDQVSDEDDMMNNFLDHSKIFSPYFDVTHITTHNKSRGLHPGHKPCIGLACYNHSQGFFTDKQFKKHPKRFPRNRQYSIEDNSKIFSVIRKAGYDIITLDSQFISLEEKVHMMNELCDCVIGYEGGIAHLAHLLKIPTIILPWRYLPGGGGNTANTLELMCQLMHIDTKTYFLESIDELLSWNQNDLQVKIADLRNDQGFNNSLITNNDIKFTAEYKNFTTSVNGKENTISTCVTKFEANFIKQYLNINPLNPIMGGIITDKKIP